MSSAEESQTISRALLNLGRISSVEGPIRSGFVGLCKVQRLGNANSEIPEDARYQLTRFHEFCKRFTIITQLEDKEDELDKWLGQKPKNGKQIASRTETYVAIFSLFSKKEERKAWAPKMRTLCYKTKSALNKRIKPNDIKDALEVLESLQKLVEDRLTSDKRTSEKILSGRAPLG